MRIILLLICCSVWTIGHAQSSWQEALNEQATTVTSRTWTDGSPYLTSPHWGRNSERRNISPLTIQHSRITKTQKKEQILCSSLVFFVTSQQKTRKL